jgi:hypothetical protein
MRVIWAVLFLIGATALFGQSAGDPPLWRSADEESRDASGKLTSAVIKDRSHYTARVLQNGQWTTLHYVPHTERVEKVVASDTTDEYHYDASGEASGTTVRVRQLALHVDFDRSGHVEADSMPQVLRQRDSAGRDVSLISANGNPLAGFHVRKDGTVESLELGNGMKLAVSKQGHQHYSQALSAPGVEKPLARRSFSAATRRTPTLVVLDAVARDLGLIGDWQSQTTAELSTTGSLVTVRNRAGAPILYVVRAGADSIGFDLQGNALFYDLAADIHSGLATDTETKVDEFTFVPDHIILTRDGRLGAYVSTPAPNGIASFWSEHDASGNVVYAYSFGNMTRGTVQTNRNTETSDANRPRGRLRPETLTMYCTWTVVTTESCYYDGAGISLGCSGSTDHYEQSCWSDGATGGGGSGGGGGGAASNHVTGNAALSLKVNAGIGNASTKLSTAPCSALLSSLSTTGGQPLLSVMQARGTTSAPYYLQNLVNFGDGTGKAAPDGQVPCSMGNYAWVNPPGNPVINVCSAYANLTAGMAGVIAIHEMLHTLGLPEGGQGQMTSSQITTMVGNACGTN